MYIVPCLSEMAGRFLSN